MHPQFTIPFYHIFTNCPCSCNFAYHIVFAIEINTYSTVTIYILTPLHHNGRIQVFPNLEQRFEPCSTRVALSLLHQASQYEEESLCEFPDRIRELAQRTNQSEHGEFSSSLLVHIFLRGCLDKQAGLQAFLVEHRNLEQAVSYMRMICSGKNVLYGKSKVKLVKSVDSEIFRVERNQETMEDQKWSSSRNDV